MAFEHSCANIWAHYMMTIHNQPSYGNDYDHFRQAKSKVRWYIFHQLADLSFHLQLYIYRVTKIFRFYKYENSEWYIDLPEWSVSKAELEMVHGADTMLDMVSGYSNECYLKFSDQPFNGAEVLQLEHARIQNYGGGGDYTLEKYQLETINHNMWLCEVMRHVFNGLPNSIYFKLVELT